MFKRLKISDWRQFSNVDISFHPHLTVLTGANGAGKTTILNLLSQSTGWNPTSVATREQIFKKYDDFNRKFVFDTYRDSDKLSATALIKETIASLAIFGYGNQSVVANENAKKIFEGYVDILKIVLPPKLGFEGISVIVPEVKYSLQGTTQGNGLTGGLPPVRFSM